MNNEKKIDELLKNTTLFIDGKEVNAYKAPLNQKMDFLVQAHFDLLAHPDSKRWRLNNMYYFIDNRKRKKIFTFNAAQSHFFDTYITGELNGGKKYKRFVILKSRQLGFSTFISIFMLDEVLFNPNSEALQVAHTKNDATELFNRKINFAFDNLPPCIIENEDLFKVNKKQAQKLDWSYPDGSKSSITVSNSGRSGTFACLHVSELAKLTVKYPSRADEVVTGSIPSVITEGYLFIESTAEGMNGIFYDKFMQGWKIRDRITPAMNIAQELPVFYNWTWDKDTIKLTAENGVFPIEEMEKSDIDWREVQKEYNLSAEEMSYYYTKWVQALKDSDRLHQEFPLNHLEAFIGSGTNYFSLKKIAYHLERQRKDYTVYDYINGEFIETPEQDLGETFEGLVVYHKPKDGKKYVIGADTAEGLLEGDYSVATVVGYDKQIKALYRGHVEPDEFEIILRKLGTMYNMALLAPEANKDGNWVVTQLHKNGYPNIYLKQQQDDITKTVTTRLGWVTDAKSRPFALGELKIYFNAIDDLQCKPLLDEMMVFVRDKRGKPQAQIGRHDDIVMATAIAYAVLTNKKEITEEKKTNHFLSVFFQK